MTEDMVAHPPHYNSHPSGVECIDIVEEMPYNIGAAVKYLWRCDGKWDSIEDLEKAAWYVQREITRRKARATLPSMDLSEVRGGARQTES
jgi:hypothetical protein